MFGWLVKKHLVSELRNDLDALRSLDQMQRVVVATNLTAGIDDLLNLLGAGASLMQVNEVVVGLRREATRRATGSTDPVHILGSIPEHLIMLQSDKFTSAERQAGCRSIIEALKIIFSIDVPALLGPVKSAEARALFRNMKRKYKQAFLA
jgi:hypothetical protein